MKRLSFAMLVLVSACASAPKTLTPAEMLLGQWSCEVSSGDITTKGVVTYLPDGKATIKANVALAVAGQAAVIEGAGESGWAFVADGKLQETLTSLTVSSGTLGGKPVPTAMIQPMVNNNLLNKATTSTATITSKKMVLDAGDGSPKTCTR